MVLNTVNDMDTTNTNATTTNKELTLLSEIVSCIHSLGAEETLKALVEGKKIIQNQNHIQGFDTKVSDIISKIAAHTNVTIYTIVNGSEKTDDRKIAISLCVYFIKEFTDLSYRQIKEVLKKDESTLSRYFSFAVEVIKKSNHKTEVEQNFMTKYKFLKTELL